MSPFKILLVDDEMEIVRALGMRLMVAGYKVVSAVDGVMAMEMATVESPDLVILDIGLPRQDGHVVAAELRRNLNTMFTPIIFLTARCSAEDRARAYRKGGYAYVTKPYKSHELLERVAQALTPHPTC